MRTKIKNGCSCGGDIKIMTEYEDGIVYVSHGVCMLCLKNIVLPQVKMSDFMRSWR